MNLKFLISAILLLAVLGLSMCSSIIALVLLNTDGNSAVIGFLLGFSLGVFSFFNASKALWKDALSELLN